MLVVMVQQCKILYIHPYIYIYYNVRICILYLLSNIDIGFLWQIVEFSYKLAL